MMEEYYQRNQPDWYSQSFNFDPKKYATPTQGRKPITVPSHEELMKGRNRLKTLNTYDKSDQSYATQMNKSNLDTFNFQGYNQPNFYDRYSPGKTTDTSWWDDIGDMLGGDGFLGGVKGWLDLGVKGMEAYTGYQQVGLAREQNQLGRDAFSFQKAAWNKDYDARKIAYNTNARDVNAWKAAQTPGGYVMSELVV